MEVAVQKLRDSGFLSKISARLPLRVSESAGQGGAGIVLGGLEGMRGREQIISKQRAGKPGMILVDNFIFDLNQ